MEAYVNNPVWRQVLKEEDISVPVHSKKSGNDWSKILVSIGVVALILAMVGVPVYNFVLGAESGAIPLNNSIMGA